MARFFCEDPRHEGDRATGGAAGYHLTLDLMTFDDRERVARRGPAGSPGGLRLCGVCAMRWKAALEAGVVTVSDEGFVPVEQGALL